MKYKYFSSAIIIYMAFLPQFSQAQWPKTPNAYSWEGTWNPVLPIPNMYDDFYYDAHETNGELTPVLPPGTWDSGINHNLSNWHNFQNNIGHFAAVLDNKNQIFGWKLILDHFPVDLAAGAAYFSGSPGTDILTLGIGSTVHSTGEINLGDGPDILQFEKSYSLKILTGSSLSGSANDNDLVIAGRYLTPADGSTDIGQTSILTGPGNDLVFVNNMKSSGVDAGSGDGGRTDTTDPNDGDDIVVYGGNMCDFRFLGGKGNDLAIWYADEVQQQAAGWNFLGPNFFGGGSWGNALWDDQGTDRLIMAVSPNTVVKNAYGAPPPGQINVYLLNNYDTKPWIDGPTEGDPYARYCITCGVGPNQRKTITLEYVSPDGKVFTGRFWLTAFEELQVGIGAGAKVYKLDDVNGNAILDNSLIPINNPPVRSNYSQTLSTYLNGLILSDPPGPGYPPTNMPKISELIAFPNPVTDKLNIRFNAPIPAVCTLILTDINGIVTLKEEKVALAGQNSYQVNTSQIHKGVYLLVIKQEKQTYQTKLIIN